MLNHTLHLLQQHGFESIWCFMRLKVQWLWSSYNPLSDDNGTTLLMSRDVYRLMIKEKEYTVINMTPSQLLWDVLLPSNSKWVNIFHEIEKCLSSNIWYVLCGLCGQNRGLWGLQILALCFVDFLMWFTFCTAFQLYWNWNKRGSCEVIHRSFPRVTAISVLALFYTAAQKYLLYWIVDFRMRIKRMCGPLVSTCRFSVWAYLALLTYRCFLWCHYGLLSLCCLSSTNSEIMSYHRILHTRAGFIVL